jgi:uncharacterized Zn-binding protein involved in type VI secretion
MKGVARLGDPIYHGSDYRGTITSASDSTQVDSKQVARKGDTAQCSRHGTVTITSGSDIVLTDGRATARYQDTLSCGAVIGNSPSHVSTTRLIGDTLPAAELPDPPSAVFTKPADPPVRTDPVEQERNETAHAAYVSNPNAFSNPDAASNGVKENYAGTPETEGVVDPEPPKQCASGHDATVIAFLQKVLAEAAKGDWRETGQGGKPSNPNITNIWKSLGYPLSGMWASDQTAWCAGFVNFALKESGLGYLKEAGARNTISRSKSVGMVPVEIKDMQPGDIVLWSFSHVNFCYTANNGRFTFVGGNQKPDDGSRTNNPSDGSVSISWKTGWTANRGGIVAVVRPQCPP